MDGHSEAQLDHMQKLMHTRTVELHVSQSVMNKVATAHWDDQIKLMKNQTHVEEKQRAMIDDIMQLITHDVFDTDLSAKASSRSELRRKIESVKNSQKKIGDMRAATNQSLLDLHREQAKFCNDTCNLNDSIYGMLHILIHTSLKHTQQLAAPQAPARPAPGRDALAELTSTHRKGYFFGVRAENATDYSI